MEFNSIIFPLYFLIVLFIYYRLNASNQNKWLVVCSYFFYGWWDWRFCSLLIFSTFLDWFISHKIYITKSKKKRRLYLICSLVGNLGILCTFKYLDFFLSSFQYLFTQIGFNMNYTSVNLILPMGISFYTFQTLAYTIDVYRKNQKPAENLISFALYISFFPQLVAGPIERASRLLPQFMKTRKFSIQMFERALPLIIFGYFKKVVIADSLSVIVDDTFTNPEGHSGIDMLFGLYAFAIQIYCDFSGYSDIAKGTARLLGIELISNFSTPYFSKNITEFWRRWHISLSSWLKDYLYISLGGNRKGKYRTYLNLLITMLLGGLWHGSSFNFVIWGGLHGFCLAVHKVMLTKANYNFKINMNFGEKLIGYLKTIFVFNLVSFIWIFFRSPDINYSIMYINGIIYNPGDLTLFKPVFFGGICIFFIDIGQYIQSDYLWINNMPKLVKLTLITTIIISCILVFGIHYDKPSPFIYFQF